jgi:small subunit ribosomal protein S6
MKNYEMVMILDPGLDTAAFEEKSKFLQERIKSGGGEIQKITPWGKRKLAYDIKKNDAGYYVVMNFQIPPSGLMEFKDNIKHDLDILRYLVVVKKRPPIEEQPVPQKIGHDRKIDIEITEKVEIDDDEIMEEE